MIQLRQCISQTVMTLDAATSVALTGGCAAARTGFSQLPRKARLGQCRFAPAIGPRFRRHHAGIRVRNSGAGDVPAPGADAAAQPRSRRGVHGAGAALHPLRRDCGQGRGGLDVLFRAEPRHPGQGHDDRGAAAAAAAMEMLVLVALHHSVTCVEIEGIQGVTLAQATMDVLLESGLVKPGDRKEAAGWPTLWVTTLRFLSQFRLRSLRDLPGSHLTRTNAPGPTDAAESLVLQAGHPSGLGSYQPQ